MTLLSPTRRAYFCVRSVREPQLHGQTNLWILITPNSLPCRIALFFTRFTFVHTLGGTTELYHHRIQHRERYSEIMWCKANYLTLLYSRKKISLVDRVPLRASFASVRWNLVRDRVRDPGSPSVVSATILRTVVSNRFVNQLPWSIDMIIPRWPHKMIASECDSDWHFST